MIQMAMTIWLCALTCAVGQATEPPRAIAEISGRVLDDATYEPLPNARVFLYPVPFPPDGRPPLAITDRLGEFVFRGVQPGAYRLGVNKLGFFPTPIVGWASVNVADGERLDGVALMMSQGAILAGRVFDQSGNPLRNVFVGALRVDGALRLDQVKPSVATARTNDAGQFQLQSLQPGQYAVVANRTSGQVGVEGNGATDSMTYFPGTLVLTHAQLVKVGPRQTVGGLDFKMMSAPNFQIAGVVVDYAGSPVVGAVVTLEADWPLFGGPKGSSRTDADGRFRIGSIAPGDYRVRATNPANERTQVPRKTFSHPVTVIDEDLNGLVIHLPIP
jgi:protocatechuate 3,4-dioxygenase beta subunit